MFFYGIHLTILFDIYYLALDNYGQFRAWFNSLAKALWQYVKNEKKWLMFWIFECVFADFWDTEKSQRPINQCNNFKLLD